MTSRIICVGNRYVPGDDLGPRVYDSLAGRPLPGGVEVIDGGLRGLDMLRLVEGSSKVIFVDSIAGFGEPGRVQVIEGIDAGSGTSPEYGHSEGLSYLLKVLLEVCETSLPEILLVGVEGEAADETVAFVAEKCLELLK